LYHYIKRGYNLASYKLDSVCQHFMSGKLTGVDAGVGGKRGWMASEDEGHRRCDCRPLRCCSDETGDVRSRSSRSWRFGKGAAVVVEAPDGDDAADLALASADGVKWAVVKDDVSPADIFRLDRGSAADRARIAAYCVQDCDLTYELYKKLDVFNNAMAMANTCPVPVAATSSLGPGRQD
jgi:hypothetical protein